LLQPPSVKINGEMRMKNISKETTKKEFEKNAQKPACIG